MALSGRAIAEEALAIASPAVQELEAWVREYAGFVYRVAYSVLRNHHDAEDAVQETFVRVLRHQRKLADVRQPRAWLARLAWRVALGRRPASRPIGSEEADRALAGLRATGAGPEEMAAHSQMQALLERLIASLPSDLREAVTLSTVEELTAAEVAAVLGIPEASVRTRLFRARQLLREKLPAVLESKHAR